MRAIHKICYDSIIGNSTMDGPPCCITLRRMRIASQGSTACTSLTASAAVTAAVVFRDNSIGCQCRQRDAQELTIIHAVNPVIRTGAGRWKPSSMPAMGKGATDSITENETPRLSRGVLFCFHLPASREDGRPLSGVMLTADSQCPGQVYGCSVCGKKRCRITACSSSCFAQAVSVPA